MWPAQVLRRCFYVLADVYLLCQQLLLSNPSVQSTHLHQLLTCLELEAPAALLLFADCRVSRGTQEELHHLHHTVGRSLVMNQCQSLL